LIPKRDLSRGEVPKGEDPREGRFFGDITKGIMSFKKSLSLYNENEEREHGERSFSGRIGGSLRFPVLARLFSCVVQLASPLHFLKDRKITQKKHCAGKQPIFPKNFKDQPI
jgi:hypothetical protein